jgi:hypothetical protein
MSDMNDPQIPILDKIMNAVRMSCNKLAAQFRSICVANSQMWSRNDKCDRVENRPTQPISGSRILSGNIFQNIPEIVRAA